MKPPKLPKGAIRPRPAVLSMAPYSPPTGGRAGKLRLDFNENTVGCSPRVIEALRTQIAPAELAVYPGACHGFLSLPNRQRNDAVARMSAFVDRYL